MRVGFDAKRVFTNSTGLGNYGRNLLKGLKRHGQHDYLLFTPETTNRFDTGGFEVICPKGRGKHRAAYWRSISIIDDLISNEIDLFHGLSNELPLFLKDMKLKKVVTIHDLIFLRFPEEYPFIDRQIYLSKTKAACKTADLIVAISQQTKEDLIDFLKIDPAKIRVVYQSCDPAFEASLTKEISQASAKRHRVLNVSSFTGRKNQMVLVEMMALLAKSTSIELVLAGAGGKTLATIRNRIAELDLEDRITIFEDIGFDDLLALYRSSSLFVFPSKFEGFGIPIVEAMNCGLPVIVPRISCYPELLGENGLYIESNDAAGWAAKVQDVLGDDAQLKAAIDYSIERAKLFSNAQFAKHMVSIYEQLK